MSVINRMLQDLDRRNAMASTHSESVPQALKPVEPGARSGRDWFWRMISALLALAVAWVAWVAYQLLPQPLITDDVWRAFQNRAAAPIAPVAPVAPAQAAAAPPVASPLPTPPPPAEAVDTFKRAPVKARPQPPKPPKQARHARAAGFVGTLRPVP